MRDLLADFGELAPVLARGDPRGPIETTFRQELEAELKRAEYQPWMISIAYEVEARTAARLGFRGCGGVSTRPASTVSTAEERATLEAVAVRPRGPERGRG
jgi:hypothetical protein